MQVSRVLLGLITNGTNGTNVGTEAADTSTGAEADDASYLGVLPLAK